MVVPNRLSVINSDNVDLRVGRLRQALPQILACMTKNLLLFDLGLAFGFPTIVIPVLRGFSNDRNPYETLHFTAEQSSWYGSIALMTQPIASLVSGWFTDTLGRRRTMILVNVPHIAAWLLMYMATSTTEIYAAGVLLGIGVGLMETSVITYVGEISHQSIRGILLALSNLSGMLGIVSMYLAGALASWRNVALMCLAIPILAVCLICLIPETPYWLLTRDRDADALKSLQWLRGWVAAPYVQPEFDELRQYVTKSTACVACKRSHTKCTHPTGYWTRTLEISQRNTRRPLMVVAACFLLSHWCGLSAIRPFLVQIVKVFRVPVDANYFSVLVGSIELIAHIVLLCIVNRCGKRRVFLLCTAVASVSVCGLAVIAMQIFPSGASSFDEEFVLNASIIDIGDTTAGTYGMTALVLFMVMAFFSGMAAGIPWMFLSEMFPMRVRAASCGLSAAFCYVSLFATTKSYLWLEQWISIGGTFLFYVVISAMAWCVVFMILPETEERTLEAIETHFTEPTHRITDRNIPKDDCTRVTKL